MVLVMFLWSDYRWRGDRTRLRVYVHILDTPFNLPQRGLSVETVSLAGAKGAIPKTSKSYWGWLLWISHFIWWTGPDVKQLVELSILGSYWKDAINQWICLCVLWRSAMRALLSNKATPSPDAQLPLWCLRKMNRGGFFSVQAYKSHSEVFGIHW